MYDKGVTLGSLQCLKKEAYDLMTTKGVQVGKVELEEAKFEIRSSNFKV